MSELTIHNVQKVEVVEINKLHHEDGRKCYCAQLEITSRKYITDLEVCKWDKEHLTDEGKDAELSGYADIVTRLSLFADSKEALEVKLNAFKEDE
tara:strand:- start:288 stop:572 length:285 start_codon:yes stop_codon:yes gene_type:complete